MREKISALSVLRRRVIQARGFYFFKPYQSEKDVNRSKGKVTGAVFDSEKELIESSGYTSCFNLVGGCWYKGLSLYLINSHLFPRSKIIGCCLQQRTNLCTLRAQVLCFMMQWWYYRCLLQSSLPCFLSKFCFYFHFLLPI